MIENIWSGECIIRSQVNKIYIPIIFRQDKEGVVVITVDMETVLMFLKRNWTVAKSPHCYTGPRNRLFVHKLPLKVIL
jgi:hypothetical protein